ncbi:hypothetical protein C6380_27920 [Pseudomonas syringae pv. actinidiae]|uniref:hypothetical protein n=1 Tax=Pseudomonas syringae TaxID=317 RepID=UPI000BB56D19|nr:hypothetical protein [Pseudomonas syringae]PBK48822.1 hypothetical protein BUE61_24905 [Pseudomonas syringae pv. actinidiae]PBK51319.1 hypothetical protein BUE60_19295 [Pseudomonas syringae pv. actinidiae]RJX47450.1 hypothetical protein C6380_27920 [Pseudomonas syringae pv. actinidiae]RJX52426.1 hypothetical protein C6379_19960 [Pseudomonas syringae pv. actinidiae]RJX53517.1 hypothetical protein C6383_27885 [Pseudomonas syringae pv. actinidiae]
MNIVSCGVMHLTLGLISVEQQNDNVLLRYQGKEQLIKWDLPENIASLSVGVDKIDFTYIFSPSSYLVKSLYFNGDAFFYRIPDGICFFQEVMVDEFPLLFYKSREGSRVNFNLVNEDKTFSVEIHSIGTEKHTGKDQLYFEYRLINGSCQKTVKLNPGDSAEVAGLFFYQSPGAARWPIFLISDRPVNAAKLAELFP